MRNLNVFFLFRRKENKRKAVKWIRNKSERSTRKERKKLMKITELRKIIGKSKC